MSGTAIGAAKAVATNKAKYGDLFYANIGKLGGSVKTPKGFALSGKAREAGRLGGAISKRTKKPEAHQDFQEGFDLGVSKRRWSWREFLR